LVLTAFRSINYCDSQHRNIPRLRRGAPEPIVELHPEVATKLNIKDGKWGIVETRWGRVRLKATHNAALHPGVVCAPYGWWQACSELDLPGYNALSSDGANVNMLIPNTGIDPISASVPHRLAHVSHRSPSFQLTALTVFSRRGEPGRWKAARPIRQHRKANRE